MTIFIDNAYIKAKVRQHESRWCHLLSDQEDPEELHLFAESIGLKREYFQPAKNYSPWWHQHYDVTEGVRAKAVKAGAVEIDIYDWIEIVMELKNG
jgi:hypothetical protein